MTNIEKLSEREQAMRDRRIEKSLDSWPSEYIGRVLINTLKEEFGGPVKRIAGRVINIRDHSKVIFIDLEDSTYSIQVMFKEYDRLACAVGDLIGVEGEIGTNRRGEMIFAASSYEVLARAIREIPQGGYKDDDDRYRHREIEMAIDNNTRELFITRSEIIKSIRRFFESHGYLEVETPILQPVYGGATARPFVTHHNALDRDFYLRISSELYLKRYLVGGFDKIFHIGKCFRNEGLSPHHNPEFTMVEYFQTCVNYMWMARTTQILLCAINPLFSRMDWNWIKYDELEETTDKFTNPTFIYDLPSDDWPLSRKLSSNPDRAEAWELYIEGVEIASGASDLNNSEEQAHRLLEDASKKEIDENYEYNPYDADYIYSLEHGLMPIAGVGIGIDRLVMLITKTKSLREITMFPAMRG